MINRSLIYKKTLLHHKIAFTLAEVMIVVLIIGIVALIVIPPFIHNIQERINSNREANIAMKVTKAVEQMAALGEYDKFATTEEFANALQKHLKIVKRCNSDNIDECWPKKEIITTNNEKYEVKKAKTGFDLHTGNTTNNVGFILSDGASIILTYDPELGGADTGKSFTASTKSLPIGGKKFKDFAYTSSATDAIDFVMDVNGGDGPNAETDSNGEYHDIRSFKIASFSNSACPGTKVGDYCFVDLGTSYNPIDCSNPENVDYCGGSGYTFNGTTVSYWSGVQKACNKKGMKSVSVLEIQAYMNAGNQLSGTYWTRDTQHPDTGKTVAPGQVTGNGNERRTKLYRGMCVR